MSKDPLELPSELNVVSDGLQLIENNLPNGLSVYSIILLIIVIFLIVFT